MPIALGNSKHLLHSNWLIASANGATWTVKPPKKMGPVMTGGYAWQQTWLGYAATIVQGPLDGKANTCYYTTSDWNDGGAWNSSYANLGFALSDDPTHWDYPLWGYVYHRSRSNGDQTLTNLLISGGGGMVMKDGNSAESSRLYKLIAYEGLHGIKPIKYSANGRSSWSTSANRPFDNVEADTNTQLDWDSVRDTYVCRTRGWDTGATDDRFIVQFDVPKAGVMGDWDSLGYISAGWKSSRPGFATVFNATKKVLGISHSNYDLYNPSYFKINDTCHVMLPSTFDHAADLHNIHIATSVDGVTWAFADGDGMTTPFIPRGDSNSRYDCGTIYSAPGFIVEGDKMSFFYVATTFTHAGSTVNPRAPARVSICRAECVIDRMVVMTVSSGVATPLTNQITFSGSALKLNFKGRGYLRVGLCDSGGTEIAGFRRADCTTLTGDETNKAVTWTGGSIAAYAGTTCRLQFEYSDMEIAAIKFE